MKNETTNKIKVNIEIDEFDFENVLTAIELRIGDIEEKLQNNEFFEENDKEMFEYELKSLEQSFGILLKVYNESTM